MDGFKYEDLLANNGKKMNRGMAVLNGVLPGWGAIAGGLMMHPKIHYKSVIAGTL
jgi:hypothetical protein